MNLFQSRPLLKMLLCSDITPRSDISSGLPYVLVVLYANLRAKCRLIDLTGQVLIESIARVVGITLSATFAAELRGNGPRAAAIKIKKVVEITQAFSRIVLVLGAAPILSQVRLVRDLVIECV